MYGMAVILFNGTEPFERTVNTFLTEGLIGPMWNLVNIRPAIKEKKTYKDYMILYIYVTQGQRQITPGDKILIVTNKFYHFNHTLYVSAISL